MSNILIVDDNVDIVELMADYVGGTSLQRWHRELLREVLESEGFRVYEYEWWHFDYKDWKKYPVQNLRFDEISLEGI